MGIGTEKSLAKNLAENQKTWIALTYQEARPHSPGKKPGRKPENGRWNRLMRMNMLLPIMVWTFTTGESEFLVGRTARYLRLETGFLPTLAGSLPPQTSSSPEARETSPQGSFPDGLFVAFLLSESVPDDNRLAPYGCQIWSITMKRSKRTLVKTPHCSLPDLYGKKQTVLREPGETPQ